MCTSLVIWYIVDGHPAGVIVFVFVFVFFEFYFLMKYPRFTVVAVISVVTQGEFAPPNPTAHSSHSPSLDRWIRIGSEEAWQESECFPSPELDGAS